MVYFFHRTAVKAVAERVGQSAFFFAAQGFIERDRTLFALLSAIEVRYKTCTGPSCGKGCNSSNTRRSTSSDFQAPREIAKSSFF